MAAILMEKVRVDSACVSRCGVLGCENGSRGSLSDIIAEYLIHRLVLQGGRRHPSAAASARKACRPVAARSSSAAGRYSSAAVPSAQRGLAERADRAVKASAAASSGDRRCRRGCRRRVGRSGHGYGDCRGRVAKCSARSGGAASLAEGRPADTMAHAELRCTIRCSIRRTLHLRRPSLHPPTAAAPAAAAPAAAAPPPPPQPPPPPPRLLPTGAMVMVVVEVVVLVAVAVAKSVTSEFTMGLPMPVTPS